MKQLETLKVGSICKIIDSCIGWDRPGAGAKNLIGMKPEQLVMLIEIATKETRNDNFDWLEYKIIDHNGQIYWLMHNKDEKCILKMI